MSETEGFTAQILMREMGSPSAEVPVVMGIDERPVFLIEYYPHGVVGGDGTAVFAITHSGWDGMVTGTVSAAVLLEEFVDLLKQTEA